MKYLKYVAGLLMIAIGLGIYQYNKPHQNIEKAKSDIIIEAPALFTAFSEDEAAANAKYLDKIIEISGKVMAVNPDEEGHLSITLDSGSELFGVICQMEESDNVKKATFNVGETVRVKGKCTGMLMDVVLVRCVPI